VFKSKKEDASMARNVPLHIASKNYGRLESALKFGRHVRTFILILIVLMDLNASTFTMK